MKKRSSVRNVCPGRHSDRRPRVVMDFGGNTGEYSHTIFESGSRSVAASEMGIFPGQTSRPSKVQKCLSGPSDKQIIMFGDDT